MQESGYGYSPVEDRVSDSHLHFAIMVQDCDSDPADQNPANLTSPLFRGLGVDADGNL